MQRPCLNPSDPADLAQSIFLMAFCTSLEGQTVMSLSAYATSAFSKHSLISTVLVVQNVVNGKTEPGARVAGRATQVKSNTERPANLTFLFCSCH